MKVEAIGLDIVKQIFQVHGVDNGGKAVIRPKLRGEAGKSFAGLEPDLAGIEGSGSAHSCSSSRAEVLLASCAGEMSQ
jgi:transposase